MKELHEMSREEYSSLMSLIGKLQWEKKKLYELESMKEARRLAADEVGKALNPPVSGQDLELALGKARSRLFAEERNEGRWVANQKRKFEEELERKELEKRSASTASEEVKPKQAAPKFSVTEKYREWVMEHDTIPLDGELSHFNGRTPEAFSWARMTLSHEGYEFQKREGRWHVIRRPDEKKYSDKEVEAMIKEVVAKFSK